MTKQKLSLAEERKLVEKAKVDWSAFEILYNMYIDEIYYYLLGRFGNKSIAEDVASETFLNAMENIKKFKWRGVPFRAWLYRIASNCANRTYNKIKREGILDPDIAKQIEDFGANRTKQDLDRAQEKAKLMKAIQNLKPKEQTLVVLRYFQDMQYDEIAKITGISSNLVGVKLHRVLKKLKSHL